MRRTLSVLSKSVVVFAILASFLVLGEGCSPRGEASAPTGASRARPTPRPYLSYLHPLALGSAFDEPPWIANVLAVDLDKDGLLDLVFCEARQNKVIWLRQTSRGKFEEIVLAENMRAPVHVEAADMNGTGHLDLIVSSMGVVFPDNDKI